MQIAATLELIIQRQLAENPHTRMRVFLEQFQNEELTLDHLKVLARLFLLAGEKQLFSDWLLEKLKSNPLFPVPWGIWVEYFRHVPLSTATKKAFIIGSEKQKAFLELARSRLLDSFEPELEKSYLENRKRKTLVKKQDRKKESLPVELNHEVYQETQAHRTSEAKELLRSDRPLISVFSEDEEKLLKNWFESLQLSSASNEESLLDVIYFFRFLDSPDKAIEYLNLQPQLTAPLKELKAELLLEARRHIELLEYVDQILQELESESSVNLLYLKAQALFEIGSKTEAIELLESIIDFQPDYKLSQLLLAEWKDQLL